MSFHLSLLHVFTRLYIVCANTHTHTHIQTSFHVVFGLITISESLVDLKVHPIFNSISGL